MHPLCPTCNPGEAERHVEQEEKFKEERIKQQQKMQNDLFDFLKHGDEKHQQWLRDAINAFFEGRERPEPY